MGSAVGLLVLSSGVFLIWCGWTGANPIDEIQAALGVSKTKEAVDTGGSGGRTFGEGGGGGRTFGEGGSGGKSFGGGRSSGSW